MKKAHTNNTGRIQHIGSVMIQPGETREVEEMHLLAHVGVSKSDKAASKPPETSAVEKIRSASIKKIVAQFPKLTIETINELEIAEKDDKSPRIGLISAITEERLSRSATAGDEEKAAFDNFIKSLDGMSEAELIEQGADFAGDETKAAYLDAVNDELAERKALADKAALDTFVDSLAAMSDVELEENKELYTGEADSVAYLEAVNTEIQNRVAK